jgi:hypothetical protein
LRELSLLLGDNAQFKTLPRFAPLVVGGNPQGRVVYNAANI